MVQGKHGAQPMKKDSFFLLIFFLVFCSVLVMLSLWLGFVWRNSVFLVLLSIPLSFFLHKKFFDSPRQENPVIPKKILLISLVAFAMAVYPLLLIHPFYDASADGAPVTAALAIGDKLPGTYAPFSGLSYRYPFGLPLLARIPMDFFPEIPPYLIVWLLSALFLSLQPILFYLVSKEFFESEKAGEWAAILFLGSKIAFQSMYSGEYAWIVSTVFFLAAILFFLRKSNLALLFLPMIFIVHAGPSFNIAIFFAAFFFFFRKELRRLPALLLSLSAAIPSFLLIYVHLVYNTLFGGMSSFSLSLQVLKQALIFPFWVGIVPFVAAVIGAMWSARKGILSGKKLFLISLLCISAALNLFFFFSGSLLGAKVVELGIFSSVLLGAGFLSELRLDGKKFLAVAFTVTMLCFFFFFTAASLNHYRSGSKITPEEAQFALKFREYDPALKKTLFLTKSPGKMAQISNKIPFDTNHDWFIPYNEVYIRSDPNKESFYKDSAKWREIVETRCTECISSLDVDYIVVDKNFFPEPVAGELLLSQGNFELHAK